MTNKPVGSTSFSSAADVTHVSLSSLPGDQHRPASLTSARRLMPEFSFYTENRSSTFGGVGWGVTPGTPVHKNGQHADIWTWLTFISLYNQWLRACSVTISNCSAAQNIKSRDGQAGFRSSGPVRCTGPQRHPSLPPSVIHELTHSCGCGPATALASALASAARQIRAEATFLSSMLRSSKI